MLYSPHYSILNQSINQSLTRTLARSLALGGAERQGNKMCSTSSRRVAPRHGFGSKACCSTSSSVQVSVGVSPPPPPPLALDNVGPIFLEAVSARAVRMNSELLLELPVNDRRIVAPMDPRNLAPPLASVSAPAPAPAAPASGADEEKDEGLLLRAAAFSRCSDNMW